MAIAVAISRDEVDGSETNGRRLIGVRAVNAGAALCGRRPASDASTRMWSKGVKVVLRILQVARRA